MAKLYFRYGAMGSAKTMNLIAVASNYEAQGKRVTIIKPALDDRFGSEVVRSRIGLERKADIAVQNDTKLDYRILANSDCILVDECQFLNGYLVEQLRAISVDLDIPVICYGLRTNFKTRLFEGSRRLMELADSIEEIKTTCAFCNRKAVYNIKLRSGNACTDGDEIELGADELYKPVCCRCFEERIGPNSPLRPSSTTGMTPDQSDVVIWLVRHGQTTENAHNLLSGQIDASLSDTGIAQARALSPKLSGIRFDGIYASPLRRAMDTAHYAGFNPQPAPALMEFNFGIYDGKPISTLPDDYVKSLFSFDDNFTSPEGESVEDVTRRVSGFLNSLAPGRYLLFAHGGTIRTIGRQIGIDRFIHNGSILKINWTKKQQLPE